MNLNSNPVAGECYGNALYFCALNSKVSSLVIVHGIVSGQGPLEGHRIAHSWTEDEDYCYDMSAITMQMAPMDKLKYYTIGEIQIADTVRYHPRDAVKLALESNNSGPWDDKILNHAINEHGSIYEKIT